LKRAKTERSLRKKIIIYVSKEDVRGMFQLFCEGMQLEIWNFVLSGFLSFQAGMIYTGNIRYAIFISGIPFAPRPFFKVDTEIR